VNGNLESHEAFKKVIEGTPLIMEEKDGALLFSLPHTHAASGSAADAVRLAQATRLGEGSADVVEGQEQSGALEEIIVTARRRVESLKDVPMSIVAKTGESLTDAQVFSGR